MVDKPDRQRLDRFDLDRGLVPRVRQLEGERNARAPFDGRDFQRQPRVTECSRRLDPARRTVERDRPSLVEPDDIDTKLLARSVR